MRRLYIMSAILSAAMLCGCREETFAPVQTLEIGRNSLTAPAIGADYVIPVVSNTAWTAVLSSEEWIRCSVKEFVGTTDLEVSFVENPGESRNCTLTVQTADKSITHEIELVQSGKSGEGQISIRQLRSYYGGEEYVFVDDLRVRGFVNTSLDEGNFFAESFAMQDSFTEAGSGILVTCPGGGRYDFGRGTEVEINLKDAVLKQNEDGFLALYPSAVPEQTPTTALGMTALPVKLPAFAAGEFESMLVSLLNMQVTADSQGATYATSPEIESNRGASAVIKVFDGASFVESVCPDGGGSVSGIAGPASDKPVVIPMSLDDMDLGDKRFDIIYGGVSSLPYVLSLYSEAGAGNIPEYVRMSDEGYDANTKFHDVYFYDKDAGTDVSLHVRATGRTASDVRNTYWSNQFGFDNIPAKSFVTSVSAGSNWFGESYFLLTMPLLTDLAEVGDRFSVSFLMYNTAGGIKDWKVEYSTDRTNWYGYDEASGMGDGVFEVTDAKFTYHHLVLTSEIPILNSDILYVKIAPFGRRQNANPQITTTGWGSDARLTAGILVSPLREQQTAVPDDVVWFNAFDALTEGADYLVGKRLGILDNLYGPQIGSWTAAQKNGMSGSNVVMRPGYAQIGCVEYYDMTTGSAGKCISSKGELSTPVLGVSGTLKLNFSAMAFKSSRVGRTSMGTLIEAASDETSIIVDVTGGATIEGVSRKIVSGIPTDRFSDISLTVENATEATQIIFKSSEDGTFARWFIDNISITR